MGAERAIRLLMADDEDSLRSVVSRELARLGYDVTVAEDGDQAAACLAKQEFDVLLLDVRMPGKDGLEVLRIAREIEPPPEAVMLTGNSTVGVAVPGHGADHRSHRGRSPTSPPSACSVAVMG